MSPAGTVWKTLTDALFQLSAHATQSLGKHRDQQITLQFTGRGIQNGQNNLEKEENHCGTIPGFASHKDTVTKIK